MTAPVSGYVREAAARAAVTSESEFRARKLIEEAIPFGKSYDEALQRATNYARQAWNDVFAGTEDEKITELRDYCTKLCRHNETAGNLLASEALWNI